jgi:hypothetical protein
MRDGQDSAASLEQANGARRTVPRTRAAEVLAASFGLLPAIFFAEPASTQIIKKGPATVTLISAPNPSHVGQTVLFVVEVVGLDFGTTCGFFPMGTVTILSDGSPIDTISIHDGGTGNFLTNALPGGTHTIVAQYSGDGNCLPNSASVSQVVVAIAHDYNGDGKADLLWRDNSGNVALWLMNGPQLLQGAIIGNVSTASSIVGQRDFNGDGYSDILWRDTSGNVGMWLMNATQQPQGAFVGNVQAAWSIAGTGDFNGDGKGDILWRNTNGDVAMWLMNGTQLLSPGVVLGNVANAWLVAGTGDFNGDGKSDILWRTRMAVSRSG